MWEFAIYPFLGLFSGLMALLFIVTLYKTKDLFDAIPLPQ
jgi:H+/Cl- antiporter ClcA